MALPREAALGLAGLAFGSFLAAATRPPLHHLLMPVLTAVLFSAAGLAFRHAAVAAFVATFLGVVLACALIDARHRIIPNRLVYPALLVFGLAVAALALAEQRVSPVGAAVGLLAYGGGLLAMAIVSPEGMGMGDVKLAALIGLVLGALGLRYLGVAAITGLLAAGIGGAFALVVRRKGRKETIPFGPYLAGGAILSALAGPEIWAWYLALLE